MAEDIYEPLSEYRDVFSGRFAEIASDTFSQMAEEAEVDVEANRAVCREIYSCEEKSQTMKTRIRWWTTAVVFLSMVFVAGLVVGIVRFHGPLTPVLISILAAALISLILIPVVLLSIIPRLHSERDELLSRAEEMKKSAWEQMEPLNRLYDWDVLTRMMTRTVPRLEFDPYMTTQRLEDLKRTYGWTDAFNDRRSVIYSHSGLINGNPFVICRTRKMVMGRKTYTGHQTIYWNVREQGPDGKMHDVQRSQTLTASYTAPFPEYHEKTWLIYGNTAAPDLTFNRTHSGIAGRERSAAYRRTRRQLSRQAAKFAAADYAMMTNEEFEVAFDTRDRNNNQQFALLFTPLAQENMLALLRDREVGYGDDFDFIKDHMINTIVPVHMQELDLDMDPTRFKDFDFDRAEKAFRTVNAESFRAIYFGLAPLLCVPMYQQIRPAEAIYGREMPRRSSFWEHESIANHWGDNLFMHQDCVTDCILKTRCAEGADGENTITVTAHGYKSVGRCTDVNVMGGDGRMHAVPVCWDEYLPVTGQGSFVMREDDETEDAALSQSERIGRVGSFLGRTGLELYRRHIASGKVRL